jgi:hypothetical protein
MIFHPSHSLVVAGPRNDRLERADVTVSEAFWAAAIFRMFGLVAVLRFARH